MITVERIEPFGVLDLLAAQRNFDRVGREALDAGGVSASTRFGSFVPSGNFGGGNTMSVTVAHGLGRVPTHVSGTAGWVDAADNSSGADQPVICATYGTIDATDVQFLLALPNGYTSLIGPSRLDWSVIG